MFENLGGWEILALILVALFIIGPERLPKVISDLLGGLRKLRSMARSATSDLSRELGTNIELEDLHPKTFLRKHLLSEAEEEALRKPFQDVYRDVRGTADALSLDKTAPSPNGGSSVRAAPSGDGVASAAGSTPAAGSASSGPTPGLGRHRYDDAT